MMKQIKGVRGGCYEHNVTEHDYKSYWLKEPSPNGICCCCFSPCEKTDRMRCTRCL